MRRRTLLVVEPHLETRIRLARELSRLGFAIEKPSSFPELLRRMDRWRHACLVVRFGSSHLTHAFADHLSGREPEILRRTVFIVDEDGGPGAVPELFRLEPYAIVSEPVTDRLYRVVADCIEANGAFEGTRWIHDRSRPWSCLRCFGDFSREPLCANVSDAECRVYLGGNPSWCRSRCEEERHDEACLLDRFVAREMASYVLGIMTPQQA